MEIRFSARHYHPAREFELRYSTWPSVATPKNRVVTRVTANIGLVPFGPARNLIEQMAHHEKYSRRESEHVTSDILNDSV